MNAVVLPAPDVRASEFAVSCLPKDHPDASLFTVHVVWRGRDQWAVMRGRASYDRHGRRDYESLPSARSEDWLRKHRFDLETALDIARAVAPTLTVNGFSVADALEDE